MDVCEEESIRPTAKDRGNQTGIAINTHGQRIAFQLTYKHDPFFADYLHAGIVTVITRAHARDTAHSARFKFNTKLGCSWQPVFYDDNVTY